MKKSKLLQKTINKLTEVSFREGKIMESQVVRSIKALKLLSRTKAIWALTEYLRQLKRKERQYTMYIETTIPLLGQTLKKLRKIVEKKNRITKILVSINPEILGGFKLKIGDEVWDETIRGKIEQVKEVIRG